MKRYDPDIAKDLWVATMTEEPEGDWVRFEDVAPLITALREARDSIHGEWCSSAHYGLCPDITAALEKAGAK